MENHNQDNNKDISVPDDISSPISEELMKDLVLNDNDIPPYPNELRNWLKKLRMRS